MKTNRKAVIAAAAALCMCISMTGCGGSKNVKMSDVFSQKGTHVWYLCYSASKDSNVNCIVIEDGEATIYWGGEDRLTLGDVVGMTDKEIIEHVEDDALAIDASGLEFSVKTDDSGITVLSEQINLFNVLKSSLPMDSDGYYGADYEPIEEPFQIYDAYFDGYINKHDEQFDAYLITKSDKKTDYTLNQPGDDGVEVK